MWLSVCECVFVRVNKIENWNDLYQSNERKRENKTSYYFIEIVCFYAILINVLFCDGLNRLSRNWIQSFFFQFFFFRSFFNNRKHNELKWTAVNMWFDDSFFFFLKLKINKKIVKIREKKIRFFFVQLVAKSVVWFYILWKKMKIKIKREKIKVELRVKLIN